MTNYKFQGRVKKKVNLNNSFLVGRSTKVTENRCTSTSLCCWGFFVGVSVSVDKLKQQMVRAMKKEDRKKETKDGRKLQRREFEIREQKGMKDFARRSVLM